MLPTVDLKTDERSYEILLNMYFTTRSFQDVKTLVSEMKAKKIPFTTRSSMVVIKTALKSNNFDEAVQHFRDLKATWSTLGGHLEATGTRIGPRNAQKRPKSGEVGTKRFQIEPKRRPS